MWRQMVTTSMPGFQYIHDNKDNVDFIPTSVHHLANQFLSIAIFLNCYPGASSYFHFEFVLFSFISFCTSVPSFWEGFNFQVVVADGS